MKASLCSAASLLFAATLAGCGTARLFDAYPVAEHDGIDELAWPRLVDTPRAPARGTYTDEVPDPARGVALAVDLSHAAADAKARASALSDPVLSEAERRRLTAQ